MASDKYVAVLQNEKCMNDAILSVLANLHKAAWKKSNYVWSPYIYDSMKIIWGNDTELERNQINTETNKYKEHDKASFTTVKRDDSNIQANAIEAQEKFHEKDAESSQVDSKISEGQNGDDELGKSQNGDISPHGCGFETYYQNRSCLKTPSDQNTLESRPELKNDRLNLHELGNNVFRRSVQYGAPDKLSFSKQKSLPKETNVLSSTSCREFENIGTRNIDNDLIRPLSQSIIPTMTWTPSPSKDSTSSDDDNDEIVSDPSSISTTRLAHKPIKQIESTIYELNTLRSKRNREDSDSSAGSTKPLPKKFSGKTDNQNSKEFFKALLSVKIIKEDHFYEITINESEFERVRKKYPQLKEILPDTDTPEKEIPYCAEAAKIIIGYLFHPPFDFHVMPDGRISVEILAATKAWALQRFHDNFQQHFVNKINESNCRTIHSLAKHFDLYEICNACKTFLPEDEPFNDRRSYKSRKCFIAVSHYVEPLELCIPLGIAEQLLNDNFDRDIRNTVIFEAITKDFTVAGFQISLDASGGNINETSAALDIFYSIKLADNSTDPEEVKVSRPFRPSIVIYFKKKVVVKKHERMQISVETTIKPYLCFETYENFIKTSNDAEFSLMVESTYRVKNSGGKRFIIGKLLYNSIDEVQ